MSTDMARRGEQTLAENAPRGLTLDMITEMTGYEPAQIALVSRTVAQGAPLQELAVFLHACKTLRLDPLLRQAYWIRRRSGDEMKGALQVGIDGFRAIAERSGVYAGSEPPRFLGQIDWNYKGRMIVVPERAQVVVWKIVAGHKAAFTGEAHWQEFCPAEKDAFMYSKMPRHMLAKDAEAQALRKAFPALLGAVQMHDDGDGTPEGELPEVGLPPQVTEVPQHEHEQPARRRYTAEDYTRIHGSDDEGTAFADQRPAPPADDEMVTQKRDPRWHAFTAAAAQAEAEHIAIPAVQLPIPAAELADATETLVEMVASKRQVGA